MEQKEEINIQPEQNEETRIQKNEERLRNLWVSFKRSCIWIIGVPEGEEQQQEVENLFEILEENFPNLAKEIEFQEVQEAQRVLKKLNSKRNTPRHIIIIKLPKIKDRENPKSSKRKGHSYLQRSSHETISWCLKRNLTGKKGLARRI